MKKNFLSLGLIAAAAFTLTNCTQEIANPVEPSVDGVPFEIVASPAETKTVNNELKTVWAEGDAINVFHKLNEEGSTYKNDGKFEFVDGNTFKGTLTEALSEESYYNLYAFYPYNRNIETPGERNKGYITVGSTSSGTQKQTGNNSMAHIAGENYPLGGVFYDWDAGSEVPVQIPMSHLSSLLEVVVKNQTGKPLVVESVSFTGSENIVGTYYIDLTGEAPVFTESGASYVSKTAKLEVLEGESIPNEESAKFYLAIKPFWATGDITLAVNNIAKTKTFTTKTVSANEFVAGKIKTLNYTMLSTDVLETSNIEDAIKVADNAIVQIEGLVVAKYDRGVLVQDETGIMLVYNGSSMDENIGDMVLVSGTKTTYGGFAQIKIPTVKVLSTGNAVTYPTPIVLDGAALDEQLKATSISYIQYTGKLSVSGNYYNITVDAAATAMGSIQYPESSLDLSSKNGETIKVTGYFIGVSSSKYVNTMAVSVEVIPTEDQPESGEGEGDDNDYSGSYLITGKVSDQVYAASAYGTGNNLGTVVPIVIADNQITEVDDLAACQMTISKIADGDYAGMYTIKDTKNQYLYAASGSNNYLKGKTDLDVNCYWNITLKEDGTYSIVASKSSNRNVMQFNTDNKLFSCYSTANQSAVTLYPYSMVVPDLTPRIKVTETAKEAAAEGEVVTFAYTLKNLDGQTVNVAVSDSQMLSVEVEDGVVTVTVAKNEGEARTTTVTLSCGSAEPVVLTVSQRGAPVLGGDVVAGASYSYTFTASQFSANGSKTLNELSWTIAGDGDYWGFDSTNGRGQQFGSGSKPYKSLTVSTRAYEGGVENIVINTSGASSINAKLTVTVGGVQYGSTVSLTSSNASYTFEKPAAGMQKGEIKLTYTQTSSKAIYIKSISINN